MQAEPLIENWRGPNRHRRQDHPLVHRAPADLDRQLLEQLRASNRPLGAYEIARLSRQTPSPLAPNQVYRILDRLIERGAVLRIELLSAYMPAPDVPTGLAVCKDCQTVTAFDAATLPDGLDRFCHAQGFALTKMIIEISGLCLPCQARRAEDHSQCPDIALLSHQQKRV